VIERLTRQKLTEGSEVTANSMKPLAAAAKAAAAASTAEIAAAESLAASSESPASVKA
jgi:recombination protein RecA